MRNLVETVNKNAKKIINLRSFYFTLTDSEWKEDLFVGSQIRLN